MPRLVVVNATTTAYTVPVSEGFNAFIAPSTTTNIDLSDADATHVASLLGGLTGVTYTVQALSVGGVSLSGYATVASGGTPVTTRPILNFIGATVADNSGAGRTDVTVSGGGGGSPGGSNTQVQYNNSGAFAGDAGLTYVQGTATLTGTNIVAGTSLVMPANTVVTSYINNAAVTLAKIQNATASSKLLGSGASGSGAAYAEITLGTNLSMSGTTLNATGGSGSIGAISLTPNDAQFPSSNPAVAASRNGHPLLAFDDTTAQNVEFSKALSTGYAAGTITLNIDWIAATATTGAVKWNAQFERMGTTGHDLDTDAFAAAQTTTTTTSGTSGIVVRTAITFTQAQADSIAANDAFRLRVTRDAANGADNLVGNAQIVMAQIVL